MTRLLQIPRSFFDVAPDPDDMAVVEAAAAAAAGVEGRIVMLGRYERGCFLVDDCRFEPEPEPDLDEPVPYRLAEPGEVQVVERPIAVARDARPLEITWADDFDARMEQLMRLFPSLDSVADQLLPHGWESNDSAGNLEWWSTSCPGRTTGSLHAARFILSVWNPGVDWKCGRFYVTEALGCWDDAHRRAFLTWASNPWWP